MLSLGAISEPLIYCLIGPKWYEASTYLPLICISMSLYPLHALNLNMLQVLGRSDVFLFIEIVKKIIGILPLCVGIFVNIYWMLVTSIITGIISFFLNSWYTGKALGYTSWLQLKDISADYAVAIMVAITAYFVKFLPLSNWIILLAQLVVIVAMTIIVCETTKLFEYLELKNIFKKILKIKK